MPKNTRGIGCGLVVLALIAGAFLLFSGLGRGDGAVPQTGQGQTGREEGDGRLGQPYVARNVDRNGCPVETTGEFTSNEAIYVGYGQSLIPSGSQLFARLLYEGDPVDDSPPITAESDMRGCVWFEFLPQNAGFFPGDYSAELYVNGNRADQVNFEVVEGAGSAAGETAQLGRVTTASQVDDQGCPVDREATFYPDEPVYLAAQESFIPTGTEVFARLVYEGDIVEDTQPILADRDLETCLWFVFEPTGADGFFPGGYEAELYVNGSLADRVPFEIRE